MPKVSGLHGAVIVIVLFVVHTLLSKHAAAAPEPWQVEYATIDLRAFEFRHPMIVIDPSELEVARARVAANIYPQASVFPILIREAEAALTFQPDPPERMEIMAGYAANTNLEEMRDWLWRNRTAAYSSALAYSYTEEAKYAEKTVEILNAWAHKGTTFTGYDRGLQLASWFSGMLYAADLIYDYPGWEHADRERFKDWWRAQVLPHTRQVMHQRSNNWKDAGILGVLAAAVVLEDKELLREGLIELISYFYERTDSSVVHRGLWKIRQDENGVYLPKEVVRNEGVSGVTYTGYALTSAVQALEIARYAGYNLWHHTTPQGVSFQDVIEWYFRWDALAQPFPWHANPNRGRTRKNPYEIANNHYALMPEIGEWLRWNRPVNGEQGDEFVTLNKGDMPPITNPGPTLGLTILGGYDGTYSVRPLGADLELTLTSSPSAHERIVVNLWHVDQVRVAPNGPKLAFEIQGNAVAIYIPDGLEPPVRLLLLGANGRTSGVRSISVPKVGGHQIVGPSSAQLTILTEPRDLVLERITVGLDDAMLFDSDAVPSPFAINFGELSDGLHHLTVTVMPQSPIPPTKQSISFEVANTHITEPQHDSLVSGETAVQVTVSLPQEAIAETRVEVAPVSKPHEAILLWAGQHLPGDLSLNTKALDDGRYSLTVMSQSTFGARSHDAVEFVVRNRWQLVDPMELPQSFFGSVWDRSLTVRQTEGWTYASDHPAHFFGDVNRKLRQRDTTEELVWEAAALRHVRLVLYATETNIEHAVVLSRSPDGTTWTPLPYEVEVTDRSSAGWYRLEVSANINNPAEVAYFQLTLLDSGLPADALQIGEVTLEGG